MTPGLIAALCCTLMSASTPFAQDWSDTGLITVDDDWSKVPAILGLRGDGLAAEPEADPRTVLADGSTTPIDVAANRTDPGVLASPRAWRSSSCRTPSWRSRARRPRARRTW